MLHNRSLCASAPFCLCFPQWGFLQFLMTTDSDAVNALRLVEEESTTRNRGVRVLEHTHVSFLEVRTVFLPSVLARFRCLQQRMRLPMSSSLPVFTMSSQACNAPKLSWISAPVQHYSMNPGEYWATPVGLGPPNGLGKDSKPPS